MRRFGAKICVWVALCSGGWSGGAAADEIFPVRPAAPRVVATTAQMQLSLPDDPDMGGPGFAPGDLPAPVPRPVENPDTHSPLAPLRSLRPSLRDAWAMPRLRWDDHPEGARWTAATMTALRGHGAPLLDAVPSDIRDWCPGYRNADRGQRAAFWAGLVSALAWHESAHRPTAVGGDGQWFGLVQIAPGTARWRNCAVETGEALLDGPANLRCGIRIMAATVPRDGVVSEGMRGVAADWGPFHTASLREDMRTWVRRQDYCQVRTRPEMRPERSAATRSHPVAGSDRPLRPIPRPIARVEPDLVAAR